MIAAMIVIIVVTHLLLLKRQTIDDDGGGSGGEESVRRCVKWNWMNGNNEQVLKTLHYSTWFHFTYYYIILGFSWVKRSKFEMRRDRCDDTIVIQFDNTFNDKTKTKPEKRPCCKMIFVLLFSSFFARKLKLFKRKNCKHLIHFWK